MNVARSYKRFSTLHGLNDPYTLWELYIGSHILQALPSFFFKLGYNCFTLWCWFPLYSTASQLYVYTYPLPLRPPSTNPTCLGHHRVQSWAPWALPPVPTSYLFYTWWSLHHWTTREGPSHICTQPPSGTFWWRMTWKGVQTHLPTLEPNSFLSPCTYFMGQSRPFLDPDFCSVLFELWKKWKLFSYVLILYWYKTILYQFRKIFQLVFR